MSHVSFRLGEIEYLPIANDFADVVMSNCVINLSPDKQQVYREAFRVLKPGGRLAIADVVAMREIPKHLRTAEALACWVSGAAKPDDVSAILKSVGFVQVSITQKPESKSIIKKWMLEVVRRNMYARQISLPWNPMRRENGRGGWWCAALSSRNYWRFLYFFIFFASLLDRNDGGTTFVLTRLILSIVDRGRCV